MKLLEIKEAGFGWFRHPPLFRIDELRLDEGAKILLIGQNGAGKSTLLRILSGEETLTQGEMSLRPALRITRFEQTAFFAGTVRDIFDELFQEAIEAEKALRNMEIQMQENADERLLLEYEKLCDQFDGLGGYQYLIDRNTFIETFGLATKLDIPFCLLSGGEQQYVRLAKTIFAKCDLMLLDEPFSFLDREKRKWLVAYLIKEKTAFIVVCHEKEYIRGITTQTIEIANGLVKQYFGDAVLAQEKKQEAEIRIIRHNKDLEKIIDNKRQEIARRKQWIKTSEEKHLHAVIIRRLEREIHVLESQQQVSLFDKTSAAEIIFSFVPERWNGDELLLAVKDATVSCDQKVILSNFSFYVHMHEHILIKGPNGSGKTTLVKLLTSEIHPDNGVIWKEAKLKIGTLRQLETKKFDSMTVYQYCTLERGMGSETYEKMRERFWSIDEEIDEKRLYMLSGGERKKVELMVLMSEAYDMLILDEPSVGLDVQTAQNLLRALNQFPGTVLLVSHDNEYIDGFKTNRQIEMA